MCLLRALVEEGHRLPVEVNPGVVVGIRSLLSGRTSCLAFDNDKYKDEGIRNKKTLIYIYILKGLIKSIKKLGLTPDFVVFRSRVLGLVLLTCKQTFI